MNSFCLFLVFTHDPIEFKEKSKVIFRLKLIKSDNLKCLVLIMGRLWVAMDLNGNTINI